MGRAVRAITSIELRPVGSNERRRTRSRRTGRGADFWPRSPIYHRVRNELLWDFYPSNLVGGPLPCNMEDWNVSMRSLTQHPFGDRYLGYSHDYKPGDSSHSPRLEESATWANTASELASIRTQLLIPGPGLFVIVGRLPPRLYGAWLSVIVTLRCF